MGGLRSKKLHPQTEQPSRIHLASMHSSGERVAALTSVAVARIPLQSTIARPAEAAIAEKLLHGIPSDQATVPQHLHGKHAFFNNRCYGPCLLKRVKVWKILLSELEITILPTKSAPR